MCPEFERVERIVQLMVDGSEKVSQWIKGERMKDRADSLDQIPSTPDPNIKVPCEQLMVKRFRRSAAGYDEQLPSDIRPPAVLQQTLNYLFNDVVGGTQPLATVHKFVWDRTRGIRNDFSINKSPGRRISRLRLIALSASLASISCPYISSHGSSQEMENSTPTRNESSLTTPSFHSCITTMTAGTSSLHPMKRNSARIV